MPRWLRPDEEALWRRVVSHASPLHPDRPERRPAKPARSPAPRTPPSKPAVVAFRIGEAAQPTEPQRWPARAPLRVDRRTQKDLARGKRRPEASIDLHGMTLAEAHPALTRFILASFATGRRLVLVVTGKGRDRDAFWDDRKGILRRQVPDWLAGPPLGTIVQEVLPAHRSHGGSGAYYVILRRG